MFNSSLEKMLRMWCVIPENNKEISEEFLLIHDKGSSVADLGSLQPNLSSKAIPALLEPGCG